MFTVAGNKLFIDALLPLLNGGSVCVGNGTTEAKHGDEKLSGDLYAETAITDVTVEDQSVIVQGEFGGDEANFDWSERGVKTSDGRLVDRTVEDMGRKAEGSEWTLEATLELRTS